MDCQDLWNLANLVDAVVAGRLAPAPVFGPTVSLANIAEGREAMRSRTATKVLLQEAAE